MPIVRSYMCEDCAHQMTVTLTYEQWDEPAPPCPRCAENNMRQEFKPVALGGSNVAKAHGIAEDILANDYHVADMQREHRIEGTPKARYKDASATPSQFGSSWGVAQQTLQEAVAAGRETRMKYGSGLDVLQANIKSGAEPDLIELSKRRSIRVG